MLNDIYKKIESRERISVDEAILLLEKGDFLKIGRFADEIRADKHPDRDV